MKKFLSICALLLLALILFVAIPVPFLKGKPVHLSLDDVWTSFADLETETYSSVFSQPLFHFLQSLHDRTEAKFTLYAFSEAGDWKLSDVPARYWTELENCGWLKIGFHAATPESQNDDSAELQAAFLNFENAVPSALQAKILRLHFYRCSPADAMFLSGRGITTLLSAHDDRNKYGLHSAESPESPEAGNVIPMRYERTDFLLESTRFPPCQVWGHLHDDMLVVFTHEWAMTRWNALMFRALVGYLSFCGCNFVLE